MTKGPQEDYEAIDGPRAAAKIVNSLDSDARERLLKAIGEQDPALMQKIMANIFTFEDIATLTPTSVQRVIKEVDHKDLVISLKTASARLKVILFKNMSSRKRQLVEEDFSILPKIPISEVEAAQRRIAKRVDELRTEGIVRAEADAEELVP
ncbi:MAG: hypothetical protein D6719_10440 [Candidatus Dadabacteria bacterium]|nr:MAG: hypothetical protein D6719_10440 [Candidatus Dadabacteria bacterium]